MSLTIWTNAKLEDGAMARLRDGLKGHKLVQARAASASVLDAGGEDPDLPAADVALGQPDPGQCVASGRLRWMELTTAGYTRYDTPEFRETLRERGSVFTNMSAVFAEPCAQHLLGMMLAGSRQLLASHRDQLADHSWHIMERRGDSVLLNGQSVLILSYGSIARRLVELLAPFGMRIYALRRRARSEPGVHVIAEERLSAVLPEVDHVVNILPENEATRNFVNARRLALCKRGARFYNVGRGSTVDQRALVEALREGRLGSAHLDVTEPEPLPPEHELWTTPNCYITPHTAGGRSDQDHAIVDHFLHNLAALERGEPDVMIDRVE